MKEIRLRVKVGTDDEGKPVIRRVGAYDEISLADKVAQALVESGRIYEFLPVQDHSQKPAEAPQTVSLHPFDEFITHWLEIYKQGLEATTGVFYSSKSNVLIRHFGSTPIEEIDVAAVQGFVAARSAEYVRATVKADLGVLRDLLDAAVSDGIIAKNPAKDKRVKITAPKGKGTTAFTVEQVADIQANIPRLTDPVQRAMLGLLAYSSLCREELLGLTWENIDLTTDEITVNAAVVYARGGTVEKGTKNEFRVRQFPICPALHDILSSCSGTGYVIHRGDPAKPIGAYGWRKLWSETAQAINLYGLTAKSFRTTFATMANAAGIDDRTIATMMGHSNVNTSKQHYIKQEQTVLDGAMGKLNGFVSASNS